MASGRVFGDYEALLLMPGLEDVYLGRNVTTEVAVFLKVGTTPERIAELLAEEDILHDLAGVPGVPQLLWSEMLPEQCIIATDVYGPTIEALYDQVGRRLGPDVILPLADQLLSRLEFIHSRGISHGNLTPYSLAMGGASWQLRQVFIIDFGGGKKTEPSAILRAQKADLRSLGFILLYLLGTPLPWADFQAAVEAEGFSEGNEIPTPITAYFDCIKTTSSPDYSTLRRILQGLSSQPDLRLLDFIHRQASWAEADQPPHLPGILYDNIHVQLVKIGAETSRPIDHAQGLRLLSSLSKVLDLYVDILLRTTSLRKPARLLLPMPYDLPSRLWRDLRWYLAATEDGLMDFRKVVVETIYDFMAAMADAIPCYKLHWLDNLIILANKRWELETDDRKRKALKMAKWRWQELYHALKAETTPMASPFVLSA